MCLCLLNDIVVTGILRKNSLKPKKPPPLLTKTKFPAGVEHMVLCLLWEVSLGLKILLWVLLKSRVSGAWPVALVSLAMGPRGNFSVPDTCQLAGAAADFGGIPWAGKQVPVAAPDGLSGRCCLVLGCLGSEDHEPLHTTLVLVPSLPELNPTSSYYEKSSPHSFKNLNDRVNRYMYQLNQPFQ